MISSEPVASLSSRQLLAFFAMVVGMFMAVLDIQIVVSSLSAIGAGLSTSTDELTWVQTSYLIAEVIIIPLTGFAARALSTRIVFFTATCGFTIMSVLCSLAWNIESMIVFRTLQGFFGGAMIPTVFATIFVVFPPEKRPTLNIIIGLVLTIAPTLGPILGGYITETFSWHLMFLINVIPGIFVSTVVFLYADFDKPHYQLFKNFDYLGVILMFVSLGCLEYLLEEGNNKGWLEDSTIASLSFISAVAFILLIIRELTYINPVLNLSVFANKNFTFGCIYTFAVGIGLYGVVYLLPFFLFTVLGFNTMQIGTTMVVTGIFQLLSTPIVGKIAGKGVDLRIILGIGCAMFSIGCYANSFLTPESKFWELFIPQMIRGIALMFCFVPINNITLGTIATYKVQNASSIYNLVRNLGGAIGLAAIGTSLTNDTRIASQYISENIPANSLQTIELVNYFKMFLNGKSLDSELAAYNLITNIITLNAFTIAINHIFATLSLIFVAIMFFLPLTSKVKIFSKPQNT